MTVFSKRSHEGYLMIDHRASSGIPEEAARRMGLDPAAVREGAVHETPTLGCGHCGAHVVMNPKRTRERAHCTRCDRYICDWCDAARRDPDYVHRSIEELADLVRGGRYLLSGSASKPVLVPSGGTGDR
jgi:hypothetical protein